MNVAGTKNVKLLCGKKCFFLVLENQFSEVEVERKKENFSVDTDQILMVIINKEKKICRILFNSIPIYLT